jgi:hypothetical protein
MLDIILENEKESDGGKSPSKLSKHDLERMVKIIVSALENLTAAVTKLQGSVDAAVTVINTPHATDAQVQTAADAVTAQSARLDVAVTPPVVPAA